MPIPNTEEVRLLQNYLRNLVYLKLFSNNVIIAETSTLASFNEVTGGGYVAKSLLVASWVAVAGDPSTITYPQQIFNFTSVTGAPGTVYGYYLVDSVTGLFIGGENFAPAVSPLTPVSGSKITITPKVSAS